MDDDANVVRVVEARCTAIERGVIKVPLRRGDPPDKVCEVSPVFFIAGPTALRGEIVLVPPLELRFRRQRHSVCRETADQIAADRDKGFATLRPERRDDAGRARAPVIAGDDRMADLQRIH